MQKGEIDMVSIVIPNWNTTELLVNCLKAIQNNNLKTDYEIIVVDNASTDGFAEALKGFPECRVIQNRRNLGFSISIIQGLLISEGKYVCFLNSDTEPQGLWLDYLVEYLEGHPECGLTAPAANNVCCIRQDPNVNKGENVEIAGETIPFMCVVIPKRLFQELGLPAITYGEDVDFCKRLEGRYKKMVIGKAYVKHLGSLCWVINKIGRNQFVQIDFAKKLANQWIEEENG